MAILIGGPLAPGGPGGPAGPARPTGPASPCSPLAGGWLCPHAAKTKAAKATKSGRRMNHLRCDRRNNRVAGALGENGAPEVLPAPRWPTVRSASAETEDAPAPHRQIGRVIFSVPRPCCRRFFALPRMPRQGLRTASTLPGWQAGEGVSLALDAIIIVS